MATNVIRALSESDYEGEDAELQCIFTEAAPSPQYRYFNSYHVPKLLSHKKSHEFLE